MFARSDANGFVRTFAFPLPRLATVAGLVMILGPAAYAQEADVERTARKREPIVFTVDVAEDLAGKFVPTIGQAGAHTTRARLVLRHRGPHLPGRHDPRGWRELRSQPDWAHRRVDLSGHAPGGGPRDSLGATVWVTTAQLFVLGRQGKEQLATEGVEGSGTVGRIVTGGTGNFAG